MSDSPCRGRATRAKYQVCDLMSSRPPESGSVQMSGKMATNLETTLRGAMESYNFQLSIVTALFRFIGDSGCRPMDDPLLDQFQRPFSRGAENLAAALPSSTAMGSTKRRESFVTTRRLNAHESTGRHNTSPRSTSQDSRNSPSSSGRFWQKKRSSDPPRKHGVFRR